MGRIRGAVIWKRDKSVCVYMMDGKWYIRAKSSLSRKKVLKSPAFAKTRQYAGKMAIASRMASEVYRMLPSKKRKRERYQEMTGFAASRLYHGIDEAQVRERLILEYVR